MATTVASYGRAVKVEKTKRGWEVLGTCATGWASLFIFRSEKKARKRKETLEGEIENPSEPFLQWWSRKTR